MLRDKKINLSKKDILININKRLGISLNHTKNILDDFINILKDEILDKNININNFGTFKNIYRSLFFVSYYEQIHYKKMILYYTLNGKKTFEEPCSAL